MNSTIPNIEAPTTSSPTRDRLLVAGAAALFGTVTVGGTVLFRLGFSLYEIALYPMVLTFLTLLPLLFRYLRRPPDGTTILFFVVYGLIGALAELAQFGGIVLGVPAAMVTLLLYSQPIWTALFSKALLHEAITARKCLAIIVAVFGAAVLVQSGKEAGADARGLASALFGGVLVALWIIWGRKSGISARHAVTTTLGWSGCSSLWLIVLWPLFRLVFHDHSLSQLSPTFAPHLWLLLFAFALVAGILPSLLLFRGLQTVPASTAGVILLLEPFSASVLGTIFLRQALGPKTIGGGLLLFLANMVLPSDNDRSAT